MKTLSSFMEAKNAPLVQKSAKQTKLIKQEVCPAEKPANTMIGTSNHYTPVENILTNIRNLFCARLGIAAQVGEDSLSIKLTCSRFINKDITGKILYQQLDYGFPSLADYIKQQGLTGVKMVDLGREYVVYFYPVDIKTALDGTEVDKNSEDLCGCPCGDGYPYNACACGCCEEMVQLNLDEAEMTYLTESQFDDDEIEDMSKKELIKLLDDKDKVKAAKTFGEKFKEAVALPKTHYWAAVKDKDNNESIALRYEFDRKLPFGKKEKAKKSLLNIYGLGKEAIWIWNWDKKDELIEKTNRTLIQTVLDYLNAKKTNDKCVWELNAENKKEDEQKSKEEKSDSGNDLLGTDDSDSKESSNDLL